MCNKGIKNFEEFSVSPFLGKDFGIVIDMDFILSLSKPAQNIIKYMFAKKVYLEEKFLFDIEDFNKFSGYKSNAVYLLGVVNLINKNVLARTKVPNVYWVNKKCLKKSIFIKNRSEKRNSK